MYPAIKQTTDFIAQEVLKYGHPGKTGAKTHGKAKGDSGILHTADRECSLSSRVGECVG
jgi:hypothetical protein